MARKAMEQSAPCTPEAGPLNTTRESDMIYDNRGVRTPASVGLNSSFIGEPQSPLGQLDPHRLRDMVVDKQNPSHMNVDSPYKQQYWDQHSGCPTSSPSSMRSAPNNPNSQMAPMMHSSRLPQGPSHGVRDSSVMSPGGVLSSQQMGICMPGRSPLNSPGGVHPSSYSARPPSNASPSPFLQPPQTPVHYPQGMQQMPQSPAANMMQSNQVPPASPGGVYPPRMGAMGPPQQQYSYSPQVQQQWNAPPQPHYVGQPQMMNAAGQRVMIQRVPYPTAGYSQNMAQPQSSSGQPPPSPVLYPQGMMQAGVQAPPPRQVYASPSQQMPAPQHAPMPAGQYPSSYYPPKGQPAYPPQSSMYRQSPGQAVPVRAYISNQPQQMNTSPVYPTMYAQPSAPANVQSLQYSPVTRYQAPVQNTAGISPCYPQAEHDMRSPQLISPTQAQIVPSGVTQGAPPTMVAPVGANAPQMQRSISNMDLQAGSGTLPQQHMRMVPSALFYGHEPNIAFNVQQDMCLVGCYFVVLENERFLVDQLDQKELTAIVRMHGGEVDYGPRVFGSVSADRITHVICETTVHPQVQLAIDEQKRCVTMQWLNDVIAKKRFEPPWRVAHLPTCWGEKKPALNKIIAINGFEENERSGVRMMITAIGARFTPYLTKQNHYLVTKGCDGDRLERCRELNVTVVNYQWLVDLYLGKKTSIQDNDNSAYYPAPGILHEVNISPYNLEHYSGDFKRLLEAWKRPVVFSNDQWQHSLELKRSAENDEKVFPNKKLRLSTPPPTLDQIEQQRMRCDKKEPLPVVCFSGFTQEEEDALSRKIRFLGASVTKSVEECTHLVVLNLWRTMKLLGGIALGKNIVSPDWIIDGYRNGLIPDTMDYFVRDEDSEKSFGFDLRYSILKARYRKAFQDVLFYLTPSVEPSYNKLKSLIMLGGGEVLLEKPSPHLVVECIQKEIPLLLVSNDSDVHLLQYLTDCGMPVFSVELVLTGILRQKLENSPAYRIAPIRTLPPSQMTPSPSASSIRNQQGSAQRVAT